ncbi:MAG: ImmA/IrrE family metallo-endopeptidase [Hyphomicrobiales bacterium]|nr:ImmA/IrrE family metallo-endopeptidase [Hyphomicrobiales bacterium]
MQIAKNRKDRIRDRVNALIGESPEPPIPIFDIARQQGVRVWIADFGKIERRYSSFCDFEKREIYLNRKANVTRWSFAAAHELGRLLLHEDNEERFAFLPMNTNVKDDTEQEHEANFFARCLLLPRTAIESHLERNEPSILASAFDVPLDVLEERQKDLKERQEEVA